VRIRICSACVLLLLAGWSIAALGEPRGGEARRISVVNLPLKSAPDGLSTTVNTLKYGDAVSVTSTVVADASAPVQNSGGKGSKSGTAKAAPAAHSPKWLRVTTAKGEGYVPEASTVTEAQFSQQASGMPQIGDTQGAGKGFSESEDPDLAAVKGATGSADAGAANYPALDKVIAQKPPEDEQAKGRDFRQTGKLGEYKQAGAPK